MAKQNVIKDIDSATPDELGHFHHHFSITMELDKHPLMMATAFVAVALLAIYLLKAGILQKAQTTGTSDSTSTTPPLSSQPYILTSSNSPLPVVVDNSSSSPVPITNPNPPPFTNNNFQVHIRAANPTVYSYDKTNTGANLFASPKAGPSVGKATWNSTVNVTSITPQNIGGQLWYQLTNGQWILAQDIVPS